MENAVCEVRTYALSFSRSTSATDPAVVAIATSVLLKGLHATAVMSPEPLSLSGTVFMGPDGRVVS